MIDAVKSLINKGTQKKGTWDIYKADEGSLLIRVNTSSALRKPERNFPIRVGVAIPLQEFTSEVQEHINELEDKLVEIFDMKGGGVFLLRLTQLRDPKFVELVSYSKNELDFAQIHQHLIKEYPQLSVQMYAEPDPEWSTYYNILKSSLYSVNSKPRIF